MASRDGSRPSLLSRLLKPRSTAESRRTESATAAMLKGGANLEAPLLEPTPSSSADVVMYSGEDGSAPDLQHSLSYGSSSSSSSSNHQCGGVPGRSRLALQGTKPLSWSMDGAILRALQVQEAVDRQLLQQQQQQASDGIDQPGAECIVTTSPSSFQPGHKAQAVIIKAGGPVTATVGMHQAGGIGSLQQQQQQCTPPVPTVAVAVHELAAAFERRCAASAAAGVAAPTSPKRQPSMQSPGLVSPSTGSLRSPQQGAVAAGNSSRSTASSPAAKPTSPFCTMDGQSTAKAAWQQWATEGPAQQQQQQAPPLPPASSLGIPPSMQSYLQQQLQQQHSAPGGGSAAMDAATGLATQDSLASTGSSSSRSSSSPFKPRPPAAGAASPQRSRPGTALRQSGSAPLPPGAAPAAAAAPPPAAAVAGTAAAGAAAAPGVPLMPLTSHKPNNALAAAAASSSPGTRPAGIMAAPAADAVSAPAAAAGSTMASPVKAAAPKPPLPVAPTSGTAAAGAGVVALADPQQAAQQAAQQAMMQQMQLQQGQQGGSPRLGPQQQQQCAPIAIARHCPRDLQSTSWQPRDFVQTKKLYEGKIAAVVQGYHAASGRPLALKVYNRARLDTMERFQLAREVCLHMRSCHPAITTLYAAYKDSRYIYLLMELAPSGNLYQMLMAMPVAPGRPRCLPERDAVGRVIKPLLSALAYLHDQGIIHRDIKLENVLLTGDGSIKLADFGLSIDTRHEPANTRLGTQGYFAPEVLALPLKSSPFEGKSPEEAANRPGYDCKVDVWSAGVVCFEVLTGRAPFAAENVAQVLQAILHRQLVYPGHLSPEAVSFLSTALTRDPKTRPTVRQLLQHPFIATHTATGQPAAS